MWTKEQMAQEVVSLLSANSSVNLGIGLPTVVAQYISPKLNIMIHSENGILGVDGHPQADQVSPTLINAGKQTVSVKKGSSFFDSALSFGMIRGGHIDYCVLGGMEVDVQGNLANWMIPGSKITGMGGAMDLAQGAKQVVVMMTHFNKNQESKLTTQCNLPLTASQVVNTIVTDYGVFKPLTNFFKIIKLSDEDEFLKLIGDQKNLYKP